MRSPAHVSRYSNLEVNYIDHHNPDLVLLDTAGKELHRIDLTRLSSVASMHKLMTLLGLEELCRDENGSCTSWASSGECTRNPSFMLENCRVSCNVCTAGAKVVSTAPCADSAPPHDCEYWTTMGECTTNPAYMKEQCARSCNYCTVEDPVGSDATSDDEDDDLDDFANEALKDEV